jgi:hypothetical protein
MAATYPQPESFDMNNATLDALSGMEIALREVTSGNKQDNEFTVHEFIERAAENGQMMSYDTADKRLRRMAEKKVLKFRMVPVSGHSTRVYSAY